MKKSILILGQKGFSLMEMMIAIGISSIIAVAISTLFTSQQAQLQNLEQILEMREYQNTLMQIMDNSTLCLCQFSSSMRLDSTNHTTAQSLSFGQIYERCPPPATVPKLLTVGQTTRTKLVVNNIQLSNIIYESGNTFLGQWDIQFKFPNGNLVDRTINQTITLNPSGPYTPTSAGIVSCTASAPGTGVSTCPSGMTLVGTANTSSAFCIDTAKQTSTNILNAEAVCYGRVDSYAGNMHVCSYQEWTQACITTLPSMTAGAQEMVMTPWSHNFGPDNHYTVMGGGNCMREGGADEPDVRPYRCCLH